METYRGASAAYVQAWLTEHTDRLSGYVYSQAVALDRMADGYDVTSVTIIRHDDGDREYLLGTVASAVHTHREVA